MEKEKLKQLLEDTARESGLEIKGEIADLTSPEQREAEKDFKDWKERKSDLIIQNSQTNLYRNYLKLVLGGNIHSLICVSNAGYGKTYTTINILKEMKKEFNQEEICKTHKETGVTCEFCKKEFKLDEKIVFNPKGVNWIWDKNVKQKLQDFKKELKEEFWINDLIIKRIDKLMLKHFGGKLV